MAKKYNAEKLGHNPPKPVKNGIAFFNVFKPRTKNQSNAVRTIVENDITILSGVAGTGKTALAVGIALEHLRDNKIKKIVILRPTVEASSRGIGFLKGSTEKPTPVPHMRIYNISGNTRQSSTGT